MIKDYVRYTKYGAKTEIHFVDLGLGQLDKMYEFILQLHEVKLKDSDLHIFRVYTFIQFDKCIHPWNHSCNQVNNFYYLPKISSNSFVTHSYFCQDPAATTDLLYITTD